MSAVSRCFCARRVLRLGVEMKCGVSSCCLNAISSLERRASMSRPRVGLDVGGFGYARVCSSVGEVKNGNPLFSREALPSGRKNGYTGNGDVLTCLTGVSSDNPLSVTGSRRPFELVFSAFLISSSYSNFRLTLLGSLLETGSLFA